MKFESCVSEQIQILINTHFCLNSLRSRELHLKVFVYSTEVMDNFIYLSKNLESPIKATDSFVCIPSRTSQAFTDS